MARTCLAVVAVVALFSGAGTAQDRVKLPQGQAPRFFTVTEIGKDTVQVTEVIKATPTRDDIVRFAHKVKLKDLDILDAKGKKISPEDFRKRAKVGTMVLVAADEKAIDPAYLSILKDDAVVLGGILGSAKAVPINPKKK